MIGPLMTGPLSSLATAALAAPLLQDDLAPDPVMHTGGWVFLAIAWLTVGSLLVWSFVRVLSGGKRPDEEAG